MLDKARSNEDELHQAEAMLTERQNKLKEYIEKKKAELIAYIDLCERLNPVRKQLERIEQLKS